MKMDNIKEIKYSGCDGDNCVYHRQIAYILYDIKYIRA